MRSTRRPVRRSLAFGSLVAFAFALCVVGARTQSAKTVLVTITPGNPPAASPDTATISKGNRDQVEWSCPKCANGFTVLFPQNGSPFSSGSFSNSHPQSGPANRTGLFHYAITIGGHTSDPGVQVNP